MDEKEAEARPVMGTIFLVIFIGREYTVGFRGRAPLNKAHKIYTS